MGASDHHGRESNFKNRKRSPWRFLLLAFLCCLLAVAIPARSPATTPDTAALVQRGQADYRDGRFEEAAAIWRTLADTFAERGNLLDRAMALSNLSLSRQRQGRWSEAREAIATALDLLRNLPPTPEQQRLLAGAFNVSGQLQLSTGGAESALEAWRESGALYGKLGDRPDEMTARINQAQALQNLGLYPRACRTLLEILSIAGDTCEISEESIASLSKGSYPSRQILALRSLGNVLRVTGQTERSRSVLLKSLQLAREIPNYSDTGAIYLQLGNTFRAIGARERSSRSERPRVNSDRSPDCTAPKTDATANESYARARDCYRKAAESSPELAARAKLNQLNLAIETGRTDSIPALVDEIPPLLDRSPPSSLDTRARLKFAGSLMCLRAGLDSEAVVSPLLQSCPFRDGTDRLTAPPENKAIAAILDTALERARLAGDTRAEADSLGYLGALALQEGDLAAARQFTGRALQIISGLDAPDRAYFWQWQWGRIARGSGENEEAIASYTLAWEILQSLRQDLVAIDPDVQFTFRDSVEPVYRELVDLLLQGERPSPASLQKARAIIESLQIAELNNFFREACLETPTRSIDTLDPEAAVIYGIVLPRRLAVILSVANETLDYYEIPLPRGEADVEEAFDDLFATLNPYLPAADALGPYRRFYDWLIRPAEGRLEKNRVKTLVFVLDGILREVPTAALHDGRQYLIEKYNLALNAGLQLPNPRALSRDRVWVLAGGLTEARQGFSSLPEVGREVKGIAAIARSTVLLDGSFTRERLQETMRANDYSIVHLATHGQFSSRAENTFLLAYDGRVNVKSLDLLLRDRQERADAAGAVDLLILSACQTAVGDKRATLGLAGVAARSGARATVATLWSVDDRSTADLMIEFYRALESAGENKAGSLRQAQLSLLRAPRYRHPYYWAPFVLIGDWL
jgi:CHAT domain-containing protein